MVTHAISARSSVLTKDMGYYKSLVLCVIGLLLTRRLSEVLENTCLCFSVLKWPQSTIEVFLNYFFNNQSM